MSGYDSGRQVSERFQWAPNQTGLNCLPLRVLPVCILT
ncbi:hypothetical protein NC653_015850 [Populus alba x Populus x berolinensis]|uniref:Uncharacterized protein n=1 Tax=Populus alba x Populus x berolinensis TaxID=444605 RepID=A0AAD6VYJ6_9ROSI|nr:hypothetical protein NC653_015850 [Populus alba x Populus x berolinensis]